MWEESGVCSDIFRHICILTFLTIHLEFLSLFIICVTLHGSCYLQVLNLLSQAAQKDHEITSFPTILLWLIATLNRLIMEKIRAWLSKLLAFLKNISLYCNKPREEKRIAGEEGKRKKAQGVADRKSFEYSVTLRKINWSLKWKKENAKQFWNVKLFQAKQVPWKAFQHASFWQWRRQD